MVDRTLSILQVSTFDIAGGAERVAWNLFQVFQKLGYVSRLAVGEKHSNDPDVLLVPNHQAKRRWSRFWWRMHYGLRPLHGRVRGAWLLGHAARWLAEPGALLDGYRGIDDFRFPGSWHLLSLGGGRPDVVHCHNLHGGYFDLRALPWLSRQVPVVLTLHDGWLLSGHCAHSLNCERWRIGCGRCPDLRIYPAVRRDETAFNWRRKQDILAKSRLFIAAPSRWLMDRAQRSMLRAGTVEGRTIPNGVDLSVFQPKGRRAARVSLGLAPDAKILLCVANSVGRHPFRDHEMLIAALGRIAQTLDAKDILFVALGGTGPPERVGSAAVHFIRYDKNPQEVAKYYQAADLYLHAARADTFPNTVIEALACGLPTVATSVGGIPEQVDDGRTGFLVAPGDSDAMAACAVRLLEDEQLRISCGRRAAEEACRRFDLNRQVGDYLDWYQEIVAGFRCTEAAAVETRK